MEMWSYVLISLTPQASHAERSTRHWHLLETVLLGGSCLWRRPTGDYIKHLSHTLHHICVLTQCPITRQHASCRSAGPSVLAVYPQGRARGEKPALLAGPLPPPSGRSAYSLVTCEGDQVRQAEAVGQDDELHVVQVGAGGEHAGVQVLQHRPHAAPARVRKHHLGQEEAAQ